MQPVGVGNTGTVSRYISPDIFHWPPWPPLDFSIYELRYPWGGWINQGLAVLLLYSKVFYMRGNLHDSDDNYPTHSELFWLV